MKNDEIMDCAKFMFDVVITDLSLEEMADIISEDFVSDFIHEHWDVDLVQYRFIANEFWGLVYGHKLPNRYGHKCVNSQDISGNLLYAGCLDEQPMSPILKELIEEALKKRT